MKQSQTAFALFMMLALPAGVASAAPLTLDYANVGAYISALRQSNDPAAKAILKQIADGPAALVRERARMRRAGIPLVASTPHVPADQNAAPLYAQWRSHHVSLPNYAETLSYRFQYTPEQLARVRKVFDGKRDAMNLLHRATDRPACIFPGNSFIQYAGMREGAREIKTESYLLAHDGRYTDAIANNARGFRIARQIGSRSTFIGYLVGAAMESITLSGMDDVLYLAGPNQDVDRKVLDAVRSARPVLSLKGALKGDVAETLKSADALREGSPGDFEDMISGAVDGASPKSRPFTPEERRFAVNILDAAEARYLATMRTMIADAGLPSAQRRIRFQEIAKGWDAEDKAMPNDPVEAMASMLQSVFVKSADLDDKQIANEEVTMAAAAILAEKARTGRFPAALPGNFPDPFSGKPLVYRKEGSDGFVVYSVGADGKFDGRKSNDPFHPNPPMFRYPAPAPRPVPKDMQ
jgi:hypothetical protein